MVILQDQVWIATQMWIAWNFDTQMAVELMFSDLHIHIYA